MSSLRSVRLVLSLALCNLALVNCGAETLRPSVPETASQFESAAGWAAYQPVSYETSADEASDDDGSAEAAVLAHLAGLQPRPWSYEGDTGPGRWGDMHGNYAACKTGTRQSPIDIVRKEVRTDRSLELVDFGYSNIPLRIFNDGHTVQVKNDTAAAINAAGDTWRLVRLQLHAPSEHAIDGKRSAMELQLHHTNADGEVAVVSVLFEAGKENAALAPMFDAMPAEVTAEAPAKADASLSLADVLPAAPSYFTYEGSLTTPDCTEGVRWFVLEPAGEVSEAQLRKLRAVTGPATNRPLQPLGSREVARPL